MYTFIRYSLLFQLLGRSLPVFCGGPIIELNSNYDRRSPWKELTELGLEHLTETECLRTCVKGAPPRVCIYTFVLEYYAAAGSACRNCSRGVLEDCFLPQCIPADRWERGMMSINRQLPGPPIHICRHDLVIVNVQNKMEGSEASIHWHGIMQKDSPWMDGIPYVTQCPIGMGTFRYVFPVDDFGTMFYHSHSGLHKVDGHYGVLVVREPRSDEPWEKNVYDLDLIEHTMLISDWMHVYSTMYFPGVPTRPPGILPDSILINGLGRYKPRNDDGYGIDDHTLLATFHVQPKRRYRFRIINGASMICPYEIQIQEHYMTIIATDGNPVQPKVVDSLTTYSGERYDVVLDTGVIQRQKTAFWIHIRGVGICDTQFRLDQYAILSYGTKKGDLGIYPPGNPPTLDKPLPIRTRINHPDAKCGVSPREMCITELHHLGEARHYDFLNTEPSVRIKLDYGFYSFKPEELHKEGNYQAFMNTYAEEIEIATINNISSMCPSKVMLRNRDSYDEYCDASHFTNHHHGFGKPIPSPMRECTHVIRVKKDAIVEVTLTDKHGLTLQLLSELLLRVQVAKKYSRVVETVVLSRAALRIYFHGDKHLHWESCDNRNIHSAVYNVSDVTPVHHPFHMHGGPFYVTYVGPSLDMDHEHMESHEVTSGPHASHQYNQTQFTKITSGKKQILVPLKDTVGVPLMGSAKLRFKADNPGDWMFHCHLDWHMLVGMMLIFRIEGDIPPMPPGFPSCGNFDPLMSYREKHEQPMECKQHVHNVTRIAVNSARVS